MILNTHKSNINNILRSLILEFMKRDKEVS